MGYVLGIFPFKSQSDSHFVYGSGASSLYVKEYSEIKILVNFGQ